MECIRMQMFFSKQVSSMAQARSTGMQLKRKIQMQLLKNDFYKYRFKFIQYLMITLSIFLLFLSQVKSFEKECKLLDISSEVNLKTYDVVDSGKVNERWVQKATDPQTTKGSVTAEYFYVIVEHNQSLLSSDLSLDFEKDQSNNTTVYIDDQSKYSLTKTKYAIKIDYQCRNYGGVLEQYGLNINIPGCGMTRIYWNKMCGDPLQPRDGLCVDLMFKKYNLTIVEDGLTSHPQYWDQNSGKTKIPKYQQKMQMFVYMKIDQEKLKAKANIDKEKDSIQAIQDTLMLMPFEKIQDAIVKVDEMKVKTKIIMSNDLLKERAIQQQPSQITIEFECMETGQHNVEFILSLPFFKDIKLQFVKDCEVGIIEEIEESFELLTVLIMLTILLLAIGNIIYIGTLYNVYVNNIYGMEAIPFGDSIHKTLTRVNFIKHSSLNYKFENYIQDINKQHSKEENDEDIKLQEIENYQSL